MYDLELNDIPMMVSTWKCLVSYVKLCILFTSGCLKRAFELQLFRLKLIKLKLMKLYTTLEHAI